jgi:hypothetical protein
LRLRRPPGLSQNVQHNAILIDRALKTMLHALDADKDLVHVPLVPWSPPRRRSRSAKLAANFLHQRGTVS